MLMKDGGWGWQYSSYSSTGTLTWMFNLGLQVNLVLYSNNQKTITAYLMLLQSKKFTRSFNCMSTFIIIIIACQPLLLYCMSTFIIIIIACQPLFLLLLHFNLWIIALHVNLYYYYYCLYYSIAGLLLSLYCWTSYYYCIPQREAPT